jgi:hypothetical protein
VPNAGVLARSGKSSRRAWFGASWALGGGQRFDQFIAVKSFGPLGRDYQPSSAPHPLFPFFILGIFVKTAEPNHFFTLASQYFKIKDVMFNFIIDNSDNYNFHLTVMHESKWHLPTPELAVIS